MPLKVAAFYQFAALPDFRELREPLRALCAGLGLKGSVLLAQEGINGTVAGSDEAIDALRRGIAARRPVRRPARQSRTEILERRRDAVPAAEGPAEEGDRHARRAAADPTRQVGTYVEPADWNALIAAPDTLVIDTRNAFEVAMGTFEGAVDPGIKSFGQFKEFAAQKLDPAQAPEDRDVLHRRHPLREGQRLSAGAWIWRGLSPQGRHPAISRRRAGSTRAAGAANVSCSTSAWRWATACGSDKSEPMAP